MCSKRLLLTAVAGRVRIETEITDERPLAYLLHKYLIKRDNPAATEAVTAMAQNGIS